MRVPLRLRVILLVTVFNVAVFGGGLYWLTQRLSSARSETELANEELVFERLRNSLDANDERVAGRVLDWSRWERYEDALIVQLKELAPKWGLVPDLAAAALEERRIDVPRGVVVPMREPQRQGPWVYTFPFETWDGLFPILPPPLPPFPVSIPAVTRAVRTTLTVPRRATQRDVWGSCFLPRRFLWPWEVPRAIILRGLLPSRQAQQDARMSLYLARAMRQAQELRTTVEIEGGTILPLTNLGGRVWGATFFPYRHWDVRGLWPWHWFEGNVWPWHVFDEATVYGRPEFGFGPTMDVSGLFLNPLGAAHRPVDWDQAAILADVRRAAVEQRRIETERGLAVPLSLASGELWGGLWLKPRAEPVARRLVRELAPWFVLTTVLLTLATFTGMRSLVLEPVRRLARGASRLSSGDLSARIPEVRRRDELADLVRSFNAMASQVEGFNARLAHEVEVATHAAREAEAAAMTQRRLAATGELAAGIAHEINNPLGGLLNAIEVLRREDLPAQRRAQYLALVESGLERIRQTVGKVLRLAPRETAVELVQLATPLGDALGLVRHRALKQGTTIRMEGAGGERDVEAPGALEPWKRLAPVRGQQNELGQAILNLLVNALDALDRPAEDPSGGIVRVGLEQDGDELHLWVRDDGPGMDASLLPRAADLFFSTKEAGKGTGLGLAIVHNVVGGHGGRVQLSNPPGGGFRVDVRLPIAGDLSTGEGGGS